MRLDWVLNPGTMYAAVAVGMAMCLMLFLSLKRDLRASEARWQRKYTELETEYQAQVEGLDERWKELLLLSTLFVSPASPRYGLNPSKRSRALQMFRRGDTPLEISAALAIPRGEVELLVKVQQIVMLNA